jgi:ATP-dependent Clp protease ATP-binding subunit ClpX
MSDDPSADTTQSYLDDWLDQRRAAIRREEEQSPLSLDSLLPDDTTAAGIYQKLAEYVKGQAEQLQQVSVLLSMHLDWVKHPNPLFTPPKAIIIGPTGSGKTFTLRTASEILRLPFIAIDATSLVPAGIVGMQVEDILQDLVTLADEVLDTADIPRTADDAIRLAERGIIVFDEFDKIKTGTAGEQTALNLQVQRRLLKLCEGAITSIGIREHSGSVGRPRTIDTRGILIVAAGAFSGIEKVRNQRPQVFARRSTSRDEILSVDIMNYGFVPELVARLPVLIRYGKLVKSDLIAILKDPRISPLTIWERYVQNAGGKLVFADDALDAIAQGALNVELGARGLQQVIFPVLARRLANSIPEPEKAAIITISANDVL